MKCCSVNASTPVPAFRMGRIFQEVQTFCSQIETFALCKSSQRFLQVLESMVPEPAREAVQALNQPESVGVGLQALEGFDPIVAAQVRSMLFHMCTPTVCSIGSVVNILSASGKIVFDVRIVPGTTEAEFSKIVDTAADALQTSLGFDIGLEMRRWTGGYEIDIEDPFFQHCVESLSNSWGSRYENAEVAPFLLPASSDSSHFASVGFHPVGFSPLLFPPDFPGFALAHAPNERVPVTAFEEGLRLYIRTLGSYLSTL